jgi:hypothetical protein
MTLRSLDEPSHAAAADRLSMSRPNNCSALSASNWSICHATSTRTWCPGACEVVLVQPISTICRAHDAIWHSLQQCAECDSEDYCRDW